MNIKYFNNNDVKEASLLAKSYWGDLFTNEGDKLAELINELLVRYNILNSRYSYKASEHGEMKGLLFAALKSNTNHAREWLMHKINKIPPTEKMIALNYLNYYEYNTSQINKYVNSNDIILTLFISKQKGCGKLLMDGFMKKCRQDGLKNLFLWTDTTCNHQYYENNQFTLVARFKNSDTPGMEKHAETLIYKKEIK